MEDQQLKIYNMFMNNKPPNDFLKLLEKDRKNTEENLDLYTEIKSINDEPWYETPSDDLVMKNYHVSNSDLSFKMSSIHDLQQNEKFDQKNQNGSSKIFFNDEFDLVEDKQNSKECKNDSNHIMSPIHYAPSPPPGLTPTRYPQKTYSTDVINIYIYLFTIQFIRMLSLLFIHLKK